MSSSLTPLTLPQWVGRARGCLSQEDYLDSAVTVASALTHCLQLQQVLGVDATSPLNDNNVVKSWIESENVNPLLSSEDNESGEAGPGLHSSLPQINVGNIVSQNVLVFVPKSSPANFRAAYVEIQPSGKGSHVGGILPNPQNSQRNACFALGKILFEIFSRSSSLFLGLRPLKGKGSIDDLQLHRHTIEDDDVRNDEQDDADESFVFSALKKAFLFSSSSTEPRTLTKSMKANKYLQAELLPPSIIQLVCDLLDAEEGNPYTPDTAVLSLEEAEQDLLRIKSFPERLLASHTSPKHALENTALFNQNNFELYGREKELSALMGMAAHVSHYDASLQMNSVLCEAAFISGHSGSGKSSLTKRLVSHWTERDWTVIYCKFDRQVTPLSILIQSFDAYFGKFIPMGDITIQRDPSVQEIVDRISRSIISSTDTDSFIELCQLLPKLDQLLPMSMQNVHRRTMQKESDSATSVSDRINQATNPSPTGIMGSGRNRLLNLFTILFNAVCCGGKPVLICVEDLQWADTFTVDIICDYLLQITESISSIFSTKDQSRRIMLLGNFRDDEVCEDGFLMNKIKFLEQSQGNINVTKLSIGELLEEEVNEMLSFKYCLPLRHTRELAQLVYHKTRGHPMFVIAFLQSIIQGNLITFSVKARRWTWDDTTIDLQMISESVAEFLTQKLKQLPSNVIEALKVASCFGQVNLTAIELLDIGQVVPNMAESLELATKEGIIERAGPVFAFSHDLLQESTYNLIPIGARILLHKNIAMSLVQDPKVLESEELCILSVDQITVFKVMGGILNPEECSLFARLNLAAGKYSMSTKNSNYEKARAYFESGISMLHANHWDEQYSLSLELYEWSVVVNFTDGMVDAVSSRLNDILSNARSFHDTFNSHILQAKFLASQEQYAAAIAGVYEILLNMGEALPKEIDLSLVLSEINETIPLLKGVTKESILGLPTMTDERKLCVMKLMDLLTICSMHTLPMLNVLVSCLMIKLTFSHGFCGNYSVTGLVFMSHGLILYKNDNIWLATQTSRIAESLMKENPNGHRLRARLAGMLGAILCNVEPFQAAAARCLEGYHLAKICGDVDSEMYCGLCYGFSSLFCCSDLVDLRKTFGFFIQQMAKRKRISILHSSMSCFDGYNALIGNNVLDVGIEMKTNKELHQIAEQTQSSYLLRQVIQNQIHVHCYFREYLSCASLAENHQVTLTGKRSFDFLLTFFAGIWALNLARDTKQEKWRKIGEQAVQSMLQLVQYSRWNFENKQLLLQAELHYLNGRFSDAELAYESSITSAREHKFINEEALARELFGIYLVENKKVERGIDQLQIACNKYMQWGALKKARAVKGFMELVNQINCVFVFFNVNTR